MDELSVLCLILFTLFLLCLFANQDIWRRTDIVYTLLVGSVYFFYPNFILNVQVNSIQLETNLSVVTKNVSVFILTCGISDYNFES